MQVKVKKLREDAVIPTYATDGSGCFDIYGTPIYHSGERGSLVSTGIYSTGIAFEIPENYVLLVFSRSGMGFKQGIRLANCVGVIDSDYRGELKVKLYTDQETGFWHGLRVTTKGQPTEPNARIAQGLIIPYPKVTFEEVSELSDTVRGNGGFGSTGQ